MAKERSQSKDSEQAIRGSPLFNLAVDRDRGPMAGEGRNANRNGQKAFESAASGGLLVWVRLDDCIAQ